MNVDAADDLELALSIARDAGDAILAISKRGFKTRRKSDGTPLTDADIAAEEILRARLASSRAGDSILGEEMGGELARFGRHWILDPIDGTRSFARGVPLWAVLVALVEDGKPLLGVAHFAALGETIWARRGGGCFLNGEIVRVSDVSDLREALVVTSDVDHLDLYGRRASWDRLRQRVAFTRTWGDAYGYAMVASGRAEVVVDPILAPWDIAPMFPIIEEAGGVITGWGAPGGLLVSHAIATSHALARQVRQILDDPAAGEGG